MRKKFAILLALATLLAMLTGCGLPDDRVPYIKYVATGYRFDPDNVSVNIEDGCTLSPGHPYDIVETDGGYDLVFHVVEVTE